MSTGEPIDAKHASGHLDWTLGAKTRDGRLGPVYLALGDDGQLLTAEKVVLEEPGASPAATDRVVSLLESKQVHPSQPNVVSYLGHQVKEGSVYVLTEHMAGGTLREFVQSYGAVPQPLARLIIQQILLGLEQLQTQGLAVVFLDPDHVFVDSTGGAKIEAPLLDITVTGQPLPPTLLTLPEIILGQKSLRKADVWLLGVIAAQLLTGEWDIAGAGFASTVAAQIKQGRGAAWELPITQNVKSKLDEEALDFIDQCLTFDSNQRASVADLKGHPFLSSKQ